MTLSMHELCIPNDSSLISHKRYRANISVLLSKNIDINTYPRMMISICDISQWMIDECSLILPLTYPSSHEVSVRSSSS